MHRLFPRWRFSAPSWEQRKLGDFTNIKTGSSDVQDSVEDGVYPFFVRSENIERSNKYVFDCEAILIPGEGRLGDIFHYYDGKFDCHQRVYKISEFENAVGKFVFHAMQSSFKEHALRNTVKATVDSIRLPTLTEFEFSMPVELEEQRVIASFLDKLDDLITLHQRELRLERSLMIKECQPTDLFCFYYEQWVQIYKEGAIRAPTMSKYKQTQIWLEKLVPELAIRDMDRMAYQKLINDYALHHEKQTTMDFHHQLKGAILDAVDDGLIPRDPTRKVIIKGKSPRQKKQKYLSQFELHELLNVLQLGSSPDWDWLILLIAKTGLRFSEALAVTPSDFDFAHQTLSINKTWNYKEGGGFAETKNQSSVRKIQLDWQLVVQFSELVKCLPKGKPVFVREDEQIYNSTANAVLARRCSQAGVPGITIHGLRHTHASLLLFAGVSIASVARRLGHASITTTQKTYLHIIQELENQDIDLVMRSLSTLI